MPRAIALLRFPIRNFWAFLVQPRLSFHNLILFRDIFLRTAVLGMRINSTLIYRKEGTPEPLLLYRKRPWKKEVDGSITYVRTYWSARTRGRFVWRAARMFWARWMLERAKIRPYSVGFERIDWSKPHIIVANHQSTLDIVMLVAMILQGRYVAKKEIKRFPVVGKAALYGSQIFVDRKNPTQAVAAIEEGLREWPECNLIFFAEGTRTRDGKLQPFKKGAFHAAIATGLPILPVAIRGAYQAMPKGPLLHLEQNPHIQIVFGKPIAVTPEDTADVLLARTRDKIERMLRNPFVS